MPWPPPARIRRRIRVLPRPRGALDAQRPLEVAERAQARLDAAPLLAGDADAGLLGAEVGPGRGDPVARRAELPPPERVLDALVELARREAAAGGLLEARVGEVDRALDAERRRVAAGGARTREERVAVGVELLLGEVRVVGEPAVREASRAAQRQLRLASEPDRNRALDGERV